jgi:excisionase family DNA binding protein
MTGLLTAREVAELLGYSVETILRWTRDEKLPGIRLPDGGLRFREGDLDEWIVERATLGRGSATHPAERRPAARLSSATHPEDEE